MRPGYSGSHLERARSKKIIAGTVQRWRALGIERVFLLLTDAESRKHYDLDIAREYRLLGLHVSSFPIVDHGEPTNMEALRFCRALNRAVKVEQKSIVHCSAGLGRTGIMLTAWAMYAGGKARNSGIGQTPLQGSWLHAFQRFLLKRKLLRGADVLARPRPEGKKAITQTLTTAQARAEARDERVPLTRRGPTLPPRYTPAPLRDEDDDKDDNNDGRDAD